MQCIILYVEFPTPGRWTLDQSNLSKSIEQCLEKLCQQNKETQKLGESCWLIPVHDGLPTIAEAVYWAGKGNFPYKILYFDKTEEWINYPEVINPQ